MRYFNSIFLVPLCIAVVAKSAFADFDLSPGVVNGRIVTNGVDDDTSEFVPRVQVFDYSFGDDPNDPFRISDPGFDAIGGNGLPQGSMLFLDVRSNLRFWSGAGDVVFTPATETLTLATLDGASAVTAGGATGIFPGFAIGTAAFGGALHRHLESTLHAAEGQLAPADGVYLLELQLRSSATNIVNSLPFFLLYNNDSSPTTLETAKSWVEEHYLPLGDFDRDQELTSADLHAMLSALTKLDAFRADHQLSTEDLLAFGDLNGDGVISNPDIQSLLGLLSENEGVGSANAVPEPSGLLLLPLGMVAMFLGNRQNRVASERGQVVDQRGMKSNENLAGWHCDGRGQGNPHEIGLAEGVVSRGGPTDDRVCARSARGGWREAHDRRRGISRRSRA